MKNKLVILRGRPTSGKSTAFHNLKKSPKMKGWIFIDFCAIKELLGETLDDQKRKEYGKRFLFSLLKEAIKTKHNILIEEMSRDTIMKCIGNWIKKFNYQIVIFQFIISTKTAYKRDIQRAKEKWHPFMGKEWINEMHKYHDENFDSEGIVVDCDKLNKEKVVKFILEKLK